MRCFWFINQSVHPTCNIKGDTGAELALLKTRRRVVVNEILRNHLVPHVVTREHLVANSGYCLELLIETAEVVLRQELREIV